jgi:hypothetical protein
MPAEKWDWTIAAGTHPNAGDPARWPPSPPRRSGRRSASGSAISSPIASAADPAATMTAPPSIAESRNSPASVCPKASTYSFAAAPSGRRIRVASETYTSTMSGELQSTALPLHPVNAIQGSRASSAIPRKSAVGTTAIAVPACSTSARARWTWSSVGDPPERINHPAPGGLRNNWDRTEGMAKIFRGGGWRMGWVIFPWTFHPRAVYRFSIFPFPRHRYLRGSGMEKLFRRSGGRLPG